MDQIVESGQRRLGALGGSDDHLLVTAIGGVPRREDTTHTRLQTAVDVDLAVGVGLEQVEGVVGTCG
jgi:hypothetical protein